MKEVVHHLKTEDRVGIFRGILNDVSKSDGDYPTLLILTRPQVDIDYPLWPAARKVWAENQPSVDELKADIAKAGFRNVTHTTEAYPCEIEFETWLKMVQSRFWSTFSHFSEEELKDGCEKLAEQEKSRIDTNGRIHFEDRLVFILASK